MERTKKSNIPGLSIRRIDNQKPMPMHKHEHVELVYIRSGRGMHTTEDDQYELAVGDVFVILPGYKHGFVDNDRLCLTNILFRPHILDMPMRDLVRSPGYHALFTVEPSMRRKDRFGARLNIPMELLNELDGLARRIESEVEGEASGFEFVCISHLMQILSLVTRAYENVEAPAQIGVMRLARVMGHINEHSTQVLRVSDLAAMAHMSESTLYRVFRQVTGSSPVDYINSVRLQHAADLLRKTELPIAEVADESGIGEANYLSRLFKKHFALTPSEYRKRSATSVAEPRFH